MMKHDTVVILHDTVVILPSVGIRMHRMFITHRPHFRVVAVRQAEAIRPPVGPAVYDGRYEPSTATSSALSALVLILLCLTVLRVL